MRTMVPLLAALLLFVVGLAACGTCEEQTVAGTWTAVEEDALSAAQRAQRKRAIGARDAMFKSLSAALMGAIAEKGPAAAIEVCKTEAPRIAKEVSKAQGVVIGRTSHRLRNAENVAPDWAKELVAAEHGDNAYRAHEDGRLGALLPIRLQHACLTCHGDPASMRADIQEQLKAHYPKDEAMGFEAGDLRGWFWVEVPAAASYGAGTPAK